MNKNFIFALAVLLTATTVGAQEAKDALTVFDVQNKTVSAWKETNLVSAVIVGRDDRIEITGEATVHDKAVVVLEITRGQKTSLCSGSMVGSNLVLTAGHCLIKKGMLADEVAVYAVGLKPVPSDDRNNHGDSISKNKKPQSPAKTDKQRAISDFAKLLRKALRKNDTLSVIDEKTQTKKEGLFAVETPRSYPFARAKKIIVPEHFIQASKKGEYTDAAAQWDYALIILDSNLGDKTGYLGLTAIKDTRQLKGAQITVLGRGEDKPAKTLWTVNGTVGMVEPYFIYHDADTMGGNSGGPIVYSKDHSKIIALMNFDTGKKKNAPNGSYVNGGLRINQTILDFVSKTRK